MPRWRAGVALLGAGLLLWAARGLELLRVEPESEGAQAALSARLTQGERAAIRAGRVRFLDGRTALRVAGGSVRPAGATPPALGRRPDSEVLVILNTPAVFRSGRDRRGRTRDETPARETPAGDGELVWAITRAAAALGARLMVDCTDADLARLTPRGWQSVLLAKRAGIWRLVVFDGAHHLAALAADPELLLLPVLQAGREPLVIHGYVQDALPLAGLHRALKAAGRYPVLLTIPRFSLPLKENLPLRLVALQALRRVAEARPVSSPEPTSGRLAAVAGVVAEEGTAWLPGGVVLAARRAGEAVQGVPRPARQVWVGVSHGTFTLFRPSPSLLPPRGLAGAVDRAGGPDPVVELGWPLSVWDLLLRYPTALAGRALPWATEGTSPDASNR